jgi:hypothetical protein
LWACNYGAGVYLRPGQAASKVKFHLIFYISPHPFDELRNRSIFTMVVGFDSPTVVPSLCQFPLMSAVHSHVTAGIPMGELLEGIQDAALQHSGIVVWHQNSAPRVLVQLDPTTPFGILPPFRQCDICKNNTNFDSKFRDVHEGASYYWRCKRCYATTTVNFLPKVHFARLARNRVWLAHPRPHPCPVIWKASSAIKRE